MASTTLHRSCLYIEHVLHGCPTHAAGYSDGRNVSNMYKFFYLFHQTNEKDSIKQVNQSKICLTKVLFHSAVWLSHTIQNVKLRIYYFFLGYIYCVTICYFFMNFIVIVTYRAGKI